MIYELLERLRLLDMERVEIVKSLSELLIGKVSQETGLAIDVLTGKCRKEKISIVRQFICYFMFKYRIANKSQIGRLFNRDHSSIHHLIQKTESDIACYKMNGYKNTFLTVEKVFQDYCKGRHEEGKSSNI